MVDSRTVSVGMEEAGVDVVDRLQAVSAINKKLYDRNTINLFRLFINFL